METLSNFYKNLGQELEKHHFEILYLAPGIPEYGIDKTIFLPFVKDAKPNDGSPGLHIYVQQLLISNKKFHLITLQSAFNIKHDKDLSELSIFLNEANLTALVPGWALDFANKFISFRYSMPFNVDAPLEPFVFMLIAEIYNNITFTIPIMIEVVKGNSSWLEGKERLRNRKF